MKSADQRREESEVFELCPTREHESAGAEQEESLVLKTIRASHCAKAALFIRATDKMPLLRIMFPN